MTPICSSASTPATTPRCTGSATTSPSCVTTDFFTPIVDDPYDWGRIAATNALSDVYAMGGTPLLALNLVAWPREGLPFELLARVLEGGAEVVQGRRARSSAAATRSTTPNPSSASRSSARSHPDHVLTNSGARPGDRLVLTKPIGLGVISTALKRDAASPELVQTAIDVMTTLNAGARDAAVEAGRRGARGHRRHRLRAARPPARAVAGSGVAPWSTPAPCR